MGDIHAFPEVASVVYVSSDDALVRARKELGEFSDVFEPGVLPEVRLGADDNPPALRRREEELLNERQALQDEIEELWFEDFAVIELKYPG